LAKVTGDSIVQEYAHFYPGTVRTAQMVGRRYHLTWLAVAQALSGKIGDALDSIEEALSANPEEVVFRLHTLTTRGELRLKIDNPDRGCCRYPLWCYETLWIRTRALNSPLQTARTLCESESGFQFEIPGKMHLARATGTVTRMTPIDVSHRIADPNRF
jgi:hypothetical protein